MIRDKTKLPEPSADFWGNIQQKAMLFLCRYPEGEGYGLVVST